MSAPEKPRNVVHPSLLKKEVAQANEGGVEIRRSESATPKKKSVKFSADTPLACRLARPFSLFIETNFPE